MSIRLYSGLPGCGKTYRVVYEIIKTGLLDKYFICHNIPDLKIDNPMIKSFNPENNELGLDSGKMFNYEFQKDFSHQVREKHKRNILWVIDECDKIGFDRSTPIIKEWMSMHRHLGQEIYLISQSKWNIARDYMNLLEVEIQGKKGFIFSSFIYSWWSSGEKFATDRLPKDKKIFDAYRSFQIKDTKIPQSKFLKYFLFVGMFAVVAVIYWIFFAVPNSIKSNNKNIDTNSNNQKPVSEISNQNQSINDDIQSIPLIYSFAGKIKNQYYLSDQFGNIIPLEFINQDTVYNFFPKTRNLVLIDSNRGLTIYKPALVREVGAVGGGGRATTTQRAQDKPTSLIIKDVFIDVY